MRFILTQDKEGFYVLEAPEHGICIAHADLQTICDDLPEIYAASKSREGIATHEIIDWAKKETP